jgi:hypothetical protein
MLRGQKSCVVAFRAHQWNAKEIHFTDIFKFIKIDFQDFFGATPTLQRNAAYYCLSFARLSLAWLFALGRVLT